MNTDGLGTGRRSRKPRPAQRVQRFGETNGLGDSVFCKVSANYDGFGAGVFVLVVSDSLVFLSGLLCKTPSGAVFAEGRAPKSETALGNRWPGAATSDPELKTIVFIYPVRGFAAFANPKPRMLRRLKSFRWQKYRVFEVSKCTLQ